MPLRPIDKLRIGIIGLSFDDKIPLQMLAWINAMFKKNEWE